ncbi:MAG: hypothetical protein DMF69_23975, partial [Acidobacteria bacterium]
MGMEEFYAIYQQGKKGEGGWDSYCYEWWWKRDYRLPGARFTKARGKLVLLGPHQQTRDIWKILPATASQAARAAARRIFERALVSKDEIAIAKRVLKHLVALEYLPKRATWKSPEVAAYLAWRREKIGELRGGETQFKVEYLENDVDCFENTGRPVISAKYLKSPCEM